MQITSKNDAFNQVSETHNQRERKIGISEHIHVVFERRLKVLGIVTHQRNWHSFVAHVLLLLVCCIWQLILYLQCSVTNVQKQGSKVTVGGAGVAT